MKLSEWLRGPLKKDDPVIAGITFACIVALALWPIVTLILIYLGKLP